MFCLTAIVLPPSASNSAVTQTRAFIIRIISFHRISIPFSAKLYLVVETTQYAKTARLRCDLVPWSVLWNTGRISKSIFRVLKNLCKALHNSNKESKSYLSLGGYNFNGQIADCTLCFITYIVLALDKRFSDYEIMGDLFRNNC